MWNACGKHHESSGTSLILLALDFEAHRAAEDVEKLIDQVLVESRRRAFAWRSLDAVDAAAGSPRIVTDQRLRHPLIPCDEAVEVDFSQVLHHAGAAATTWVFSSVRTLPSLSRICRAAWFAMSRSC